MKNIAFAGCAHIHTPSFIKMLKERSGEFKVVKVWDHNAERAKANAESLNAVVCETPEEIANDPVPCYFTSSAIHCCRSVYIGIENQSEIRTA